jgi:hypothetical protein
MSSVAFSNSIAGIDGGSLPPRNIAHVGQMMRDALVAIDARLLARKKEPLMGLNRTGALARNVHRLGAMAIATFKRIVRLHARPFMLGEFEAMAGSWRAVAPPGRAEWTLAVQKTSVP